MTSSPNSAARIPVPAFLRRFFLNLIAHRDREQHHRRHPRTAEQERSTPPQSLNLLERLGRMIEMGQRVAKGTTH